MMDKDERYILYELAYAAGRPTWFEIGGNLAIKLQEMMTRKDAEIERLRDVLEDLMAVQNGPPLTEFQSEWLDAMMRASDMLYEGTERKGDRGKI